MNLDKAKKERKTFKTSEVIILILITFLVSAALGCSIGYIEGVSKKIKPYFKDTDQSIVKNDENLKKFIDNYKYIINNYYTKVDKSKLIDDAIAGMMETLDDPYSVYMDEEESSSFNISLDGEYEGLGVQIIKDDDKKKILVLYVFDDSPAYKAGLKSGDYIIKLDGVDVADKTVTEFSDMVLSSKKNEFKLTVLRDNKEMELTVNKDHVVLNSVMSQVFEKNNKKVGYIRISIFANNTAKQFRKELKLLENQKIDSLVIDVRENTGGHLTSVKSILESLLTKDQITYQLSNNKKIIKNYGKSKKNKDYKIALLGNNNSASASEILIASLMENLKVKFFGEKTYGKGTVQELVNLSDGEQYKITTKKWLTPKGHWINDTKGIQPTDEVKLDKEIYENYDQDKDNQLQSAIDYLAK